jgi:U4/U6.U5 tri-snRNP-associated protein 3
MRGDDRRDDRRDRSYSGRDRPPSRDGDAARRRGEVDEFGRPLRREPLPDFERRGDDERKSGWKRARSRSRSRSPGPPAKRRPPLDADSAAGGGRGVRSVPPPPARRPEPPPPPPPSDAPPPPPDAPDGDDGAEMMALMGFGGFGSTAGKHVDDPNVNVGAVRKKTTRKARQYMNRPGGFNRPLPEEKTGIKQNKI